MEVIKARNVHEALPKALDLLRRVGVERQTRNGLVTMFPTPVTTAYQRPEERVIFWPERDANPFFHLYESLWMLAGRNDVESVARYVKRMKTFSDDGKTFHGAYGFRWRLHFELDQLAAIIALLQANPDDRRCVLQMWDARTDLGRAGKDFPCNLSAVFQVNSDGKLDMTVYNRSNDIIWGAYGANAVHFSILQEYVARSISRDVGTYYQVSANFHAYHETLLQVDGLADKAPDPFGELREHQPYSEDVAPYPLMQTSYTSWNNDLVAFMEHGAPLGIRDPFFRKVAIPMQKAHDAFKLGRGRQKFDQALEWVERIGATDWQRACREWLQRRLVKYERANDDGVQS